MLLLGFRGRVGGGGRPATTVQDGSLMEHRRWYSISEKEWKFQGAESLRSPESETPGVRDSFRAKRFDLSVFLNGDSVTPESAP